ncbi:hypothetical protein GCM10007291_25340 [Gemmobacter nanjingensis]|uniref:Phage derived protein Gp49-like n=1 Tax=Gemmobacter nanjingensis TaxID=488454 RepID=A0ABQ3FHL6_9RHOB|nr:hypothetical protein GCM10007291_25340 [Gemmobacter nanjingensis]
MLPSHIRLARLARTQHTLPSLWFFVAQKSEILAVFRYEQKCAKSVRHARKFYNLCRDTVADGAPQGMGIN